VWIFGILHVDLAKRRRNEERNEEERDKGWGGNKGRGRGGCSQKNNVDTTLRGKKKTKPTVASREKEEQDTNENGKGGKELGGPGLGVVRPEMVLVF
jgi:hypothetical protein